MSVIEFNVINLNAIIEKMEKSDGKIFLGKYICYNDKEFLYNNVARILEKRGCKLTAEEHLIIVLFMVWHFKYDMHEDIKKYCEEEYGFLNIKIYESSLIYLKDNFNSFLNKTEKMNQYVETLKTHSIIYSTKIDEFIESIFKIYFYRFSERLNEIDVERFVDAINNEDSTHKFTQLMQSGKMCFVHSLDINKREVKKFIYAILEQIDAVWYRDNVFTSDYLEQFYIDKIENVVNNSNILDRKQSKNIELGNRCYIRKRKVELVDGRKLKIIFPEKIITKEELRELSIDEKAKIHYRLFSAKGEMSSNVDELNSKWEHIYFDQMSDLEKLRMKSFHLIVDKVYDDLKLDILIDGKKYHTVEISDLIPDNKLIMFDESGQKINRISDAETIVAHNKEIFNYTDVSYDIGDFSIYHLKGRRMEYVVWNGSVYNSFQNYDTGILGNNKLKGVRVRSSNKMYNNIYANSISINTKYDFEDTRFRIGSKNVFPSVRKSEVEYDGKENDIRFFSYYPKNKFDIIDKIAIREAGSKIKKDEQMENIVIFNSFEFKFRNSTYFKFLKNGPKEDKSLLEYLNVNGNNLMHLVEEKGECIRFKYDEGDYKDLIVFLYIPYVKIEVDDMEIYDTIQYIFFEGLKQIYSKQELNIYQDNKKLDVTYNKTKMKYQYSLIKPKGKEMLLIEQDGEMYLISNIYDEMYFELNIQDNNVEEAIIKINVINSSGACDTIIKEYNEKNEMVQEQVYAISNNTVSELEFKKRGGTYIKIFKESKSRFTPQITELETHYYSKYDEFVTSDILKFKVIETERGVKKFGEHDISLNINTNLKTKTENMLEVYSFYTLGNEKRNHSNCPFKMILVDEDNLIFEIYDRDDEPVEICTRTGKINPASGGDRTISKVKGVLL